MLLKSDNTIGTSYEDLNTFLLTCRSVQTYLWRRAKHILCSV